MMDRINYHEKLRPFRKEILKEMRRREREGPVNGLDGMFLGLAEDCGIYPDDIVEKYIKKLDEPDGWEGDLINQL